ncbi:hypothetical protein L3X38_000123 [Prunus dulcis]|uniref:Uncharacterized protein n=1 Tax=Prunus dulcis TaxID=3755 RepID=A0AAD4US88_PRUDU|nr:hypothetical protein L3X38_000123 [Prunus dulcis]
MVGEFSAAQFSSVFFNLRCSFDKMSFAKVVPQLTTMTYPKSEQSNYSSYVCDDNTSFMKVVQKSFRQWHT